MYLYWIHPYILVQVLVHVSVFLGDSELELLEDLLYLADCIKKYAIHWLRAERESKRGESHRTRTAMVLAHAFTLCQLRMRHCCVEKQQQRYNIYSQFNLNESALCRESHKRGFSSGKMLHFLSFSLCAFLPCIFKTIVFSLQWERWMVVVCGSSIFTCDATCCAPLCADGTSKMVFNGTFIENGKAPTRGQRGGIKLLCNLSKGQLNDIFYASQCRHFPLTI